MLSTQWSGNGRYGHLLPSGTDSIEETLEPDPRTCIPWGNVCAPTSSHFRGRLSGDVIPAGGPGDTWQGSPVMVAWGLQSHRGWFEPQTNRKEACGSPKQHLDQVFMD